jgi:hypothetical protein
MTRQLATGILASVLVASACGPSAEQKQAEEAAKAAAEATKTGADQMAQGAAAMAKGFEDLAKGMTGAATGKVDVLPFEKLGEALPEVSGWKRGEITGSSTTMPFAMSQSEATYENGDSRVEVEVVDTALNQMILAPFSMFLVQNYSERSSDGYKKGATFKGHPAFEEVDYSSKTGELTVVVDKRFIVHARGRNVKDVEPARTVLDKMDFGKLTAAK